jgi:hypothetical protein
MGLAFVHAPTMIEIAKSARRIPASAQIDDNDRD